MNYDTIIVELLAKVKILEKRVKIMEKRLIQEGVFDEDDDPAPVLEEWFIQNIRKLKIEQGYYDEDVIFNIDNEYGIE